MISYKIKRLFIISLGIVILVLAARDGAREKIPVVKKPRIPYPIVPADLLANSINLIMDASTTSPIVVTPPKPVAQRPLISAEAYMVANLDTGEVYKSYNSNKVFPIASLSKLVTAIVAMHKMQPDQIISITQKILDDGYGDAGHFALGESFTVSEILNPLLLESSNDAAEALAQSYGYMQFIGEMNAFVSELGMKSTFFRDASGLSSANASNAEDLLTLARYIYAKEQPLLEITRKPVDSVTSTTDHGAHVWNSINPFPLDPHFMGGKTGRTNAAKESMVSLFKYEFGGITYPLAIIVLRSDFSVREMDSSMLFEQFMQKMGKIQ